MIRVFRASEHTPPELISTRRGLERALASSGLTPKERAAVKSAVASIGPTSSADIVLLSGGDVFRVLAVDTPALVGPAGAAHLDWLARTPARLVVLEDDPEVERLGNVLGFLGYDVRTVITKEESPDDLARAAALHEAAVAILGRKLALRCGAPLVEKLRADGVATISLGAPVAADLELPLPLQTTKLARLIDGLVEP